MAPARSPAPAQRETAFLAGSASPAAGSRGAGVGAHLFSGGGVAGDLPAVQAADRLAGRGDQGDGPAQGLAGRAEMHQAALLGSGPPADFVRLSKVQRVQIGGAVGRGPGTAQRAILDALAASVEPWLTIPDLAEATGRSPRQVRTAVHALQARGLVAITKGETGWRGRGDYGHWRQAGPSEWDDPRTVTVQPGSRTPAGWALGEDFPAPMAFIRGGVPVSGLLVWLPERKVAAEDTKRTALAIAAAFREQTRRPHPA